jgi:RHH-type proline utilization regulon transcriptional repressor/proline dehydrogenase/delta 1-pyrroline-5-carboxylate dehydrogenase
VPLEIRRAAAEALQYIADAPPVSNGRVELVWYFQEQSLTVLYHRYGNLGRRVDEPRDEPA